MRTDSTAQAYEKVIAGIGSAVFVSNPAVGRAVFSAAGKGAGEAATTFAGNMVDFYISMFVAKQAAPMVQAVVLMMIYMLLLFYMLMSNYEIESVVQMIFIILGIQFFTTLWNFADYLDAQLFVAMHPDVTFLGSALTMGINRLLLDAVLALLYIVAPFLLLWVMGMAGSRVGNLPGSLGPLKSHKGVSGGAGKGASGGVGKKLSE